MPPSKQELIDAMGSAYTNETVPRLRRLAHIPKSLLQSLAGVALAENWGRNEYVLEKYLAVHIAWSIEQERYTATDEQIFVTAGHLQTRYETPLYVVFERNLNPDRQHAVLCLHRL